MWERVHNDEMPQRGNHIACMLCVVKQGLSFLFVFLSFFKKYCTTGNQIEYLNQFLACSSFTSKSMYVIPFLKNKVNSSGHILFAMYE